MTELTFADERIIEGKEELKQRGELRLERQQRADGESKEKIQKRWRLVQGVVLLLQNVPRYSFDISMWVPTSHIGDKWAGTPAVNMGPTKNTTCDCELLGHWYGHYGLLVYNKNHKN